MYEKNLQLNSQPFTSAPFVKHYYPAQTIQKSLASSRLCIDRGSGPVVVIGDAGTGKSLLLAMLEEQYRTQFSVVHLACARLDERQELLQSILFELHLPYRKMSEGELRLSLMEYLKPSQACPNGVLLLVDEAHNLSVELLDEIRLITNFVRDGQPRVRLVLSGNQRLEERLADRKMTSFNQRIAARCYLTTLSQAETADYVVTHIDRAGGDGKRMFGEKSVRAIHELTEGYPRYINQLCDHALILTATRGTKTIDEALIREAWADVQCLPGSMPVDPSDQKFTKSTSSKVRSIEPEDENWTVIEFGHLDDEGDAPSTNSSEIEFGNESEFHSHQQQKDHPLNSQSIADDSHKEHRESNFEEIESASSDATRDIKDQSEDFDHYVGFQSSGTPEDPFAEDFEDEERIVDRYAPLVAAHNQSSMRLTKDELKYLKPLDQVSPATSITGFEKNLAATDRSETNSTTASRVCDQPANKPSTSSTRDDTSADLERQADEILRSLNQHETIENTGSNHNHSVPHETDIDNDDDVNGTIKIIDRKAPFATVSFLSDDDSESENMSTHSVDEQRLLKDIIEEKNRVTAKTFGDAATDEPDCDEGEYHSNDDQDLLVVHHDDSRVVRSKPRVEPIPFPATPVSTGRAKRMNYQQLFDQLRCMSND